MNEDKPVTEVDDTQDVESEAEKQLSDAFHDRYLKEISEITTNRN